MGLARRLGVARDTVRRWVRAGWVTTRRDAEGHHVIWADASELRRLRELHRLPRNGDRRGPGRIEEAEAPPGAVECRWPGSRRAGPPHHALGGHYGWNIEITFRECKQVVGAGQQQVRFIWANIGAFHVCLWTFTMTEAWAWGRKDGGVGGPLGLAVGQRRHAARATRTSGGRGVVNCWARRFVRFYAPGRPRRKFRPPPKGCSAWPHDIYILPESTVYNESREYLVRWEAWHVLDGWAYVAREAELG